MVVEKTDALDAPDESVEGSAGSGNETTLVNVLVTPGAEGETFVMQMFVATWTSMAMLRDKCNEVIIDMDEYPCDEDSGLILGFTSQFTDGLGLEADDTMVFDMDGFDNGRDDQVQLCHRAPDMCTRPQVESKATLSCCLLIFVSHNLISSQGAVASPQGLNPARLQVLLAFTEGGGEEYWGSQDTFSNESWMVIDVTDPWGKD